MPITCNRCGKEVAEAKELPAGTVGFYDVRGGNFWAKYAREGEEFVCDPCMWTDERFLADFPHMRGSEKRS